MRQITIGHLGHFLSDLFGHILGPILVIFEIGHFLMIPGPLEYFSEWVVSENQSFLNKGAKITPLLV